MFIDRDRSNPSETFTGDQFTSLSLSCTCSFPFSAYTLSLFCRLFISTLKKKKFHFHHLTVHHSVATLFRAVTRPITDVTQPKSLGSNPDRCVVQMPSQGQSENTMPAITFCLIGKVEGNASQCVCKRQRKKVFYRERADIPPLVISG